MTMAAQRWVRFLHDGSVGFGTLSKIGFPGEASGRLRAYQSWKPIEQATMSYGHGISVSLLQLARVESGVALQREPVDLVQLAVLATAPPRAFRRHPSRRRSRAGG